MFTGVIFNGHVFRIVVNLPFSSALAGSVGFYNVGLEWFFSNFRLVTVENFTVVLRK